MSCCQTSEDFFSLQIPQTNTLVVFLLPFNVKRCARRRPLWYAIAVCVLYTNTIMRLGFELRALLNSQTEPPPRRPRFFSQYPLYILSAVEMFVLVVPSKNMLVHDFSFTWTLCHNSSFWWWRFVNNNGPRFLKYQGMRMNCLTMVISNL